MSKILFLCNHFFGLYAYRKELIGKLVKNGHQVFLSIPENEENVYFENLGCEIIPTEVDRRGTNPIKDIKLYRAYKKIIKEIDPDIIFSYTIKSNIYGAMASNKTGHRQVCNITGTGGIFLKKDLFAALGKFLYRISVKKCYKVFFQNNGDKDFFVKNKLVKDNYELIPGSGCNLEENTIHPMPDDETVKFIFIGRVMKLKGIDEYLECAKNIKTKYPNTVFYIAGSHEEDYSGIIAEYRNNGYVEDLGFRKDIRDWIRLCHCTVLPSHGGEGVPNVLLESAAAGRACIGSRVNGTMDVIDDNVTGFLFDAGNADDLAMKIEKFIKLSYNEKSRMGIAGRKKVEEKFDRNIVIEKYIEEVSKVVK